MFLKQNMFYKSIISTIISNTNQVQERLSTATLAKKRENDTSEEKSSVS